MLVEVSAYHLAIARPTRESDRGAMHSDETLSIVVDKRKESGFLFVIHFEVAAGVEKNGVKIV